MKILLYGINYSPELTGVGKYSGEMGRWLASQPHDIRVITAPPYYPDWQVSAGYRAWWYSHRSEAGVSVYRCPLYVPSQPSAIKRLLHLFSFSFSSAWVVLAQARWKPQLIILVAPTMICAPQALLLAKLCAGTTVLHIQDFEVDALFDLELLGGGPFRRLAYLMERKLLGAFDRVATISPAMLQRARAKGVQPARLILFPNWSETLRFRTARRSNELLAQLGVLPGQRMVLYAGNLGEKQGLEVLLEVAQHLQRRAELVLVVVGEGATKARLQALAQEGELGNLMFAPLQSYEDLPALLASADCHLVVQKRGAADLVLPSKLTNILAVGGNAVITADAETTLGQLCSDFPGIAIRVEPESVEALVDGIEACLLMPVRNPIAVGYADAHLAKEPILSRFMRELNL